MKLKWILTNTHIIVSTLGVAAFAAGCCSKGTGGSYSSTAPPYPETTAQAQPLPPTGAVSGTQTIPLYKEQVNVGSQQVNDGTVTIKKIVKTETVNEPVTLRKESLVIDRQPASGQEQPGSQAFQEQQVTIQLHHDEPFVSTQVVPNGQVVATTKADQQQTTIQKQVRSEDVTIDKGNAQNVTISDSLKDQTQPMGGGGDTGGQSSGGSQDQNK
jgi:uncharacterized protein (TIGR02271 family)